MSTFPSPEQQQVIEYPLLPLRVTAGAGSGKTATMAARLAHVVAHHGVAPEEALGITFTNKAAGELADRVRRALPEATAEGREVEIATYHGFAHGLLREFGPLVGIPREVRIVTPGYTRQLIRDAIGERPRPLLDLTQPGRVVDRIAHLASALGDHLVDPATLLIDPGDDAPVARPGDDAPVARPGDDAPVARPGDDAPVARPGDDAPVARPGDDAPVAAERSALAEVIVDYQRRKQRLGVVDFSDLVALAHRLVSSHPDLAARIRNRYRIVLLDEYQDTNPGQRELLRAIFGTSGFPVTAVGDTDQTIYEWRGASPHNFAGFGEHFPGVDGPARTLDLSITWRSDRRIVDVANLVRQEIADRGPLPALRARADAESGTVITHWLTDAHAEARWLASEVERLHESGLRWCDMAVLFRKHRQMAVVRDALVERGIPVEVASLGGLLEVPEIVDLHAWLRILGRPDDAVALLRVLTGWRHRLGLGDLVPLARWVRERNGTVGVDDEALGWELLEAVDELDSVAELDSETRRRLEGFRDLYRRLLVTAQGVSLVELCRIVLDRTGVWPEVDARDDAARLSGRLNLYRFLDLAEDWSPLEGAPSLSAFLDHLDLLSEDGAGDELDTARISGEDAVPLLTVHRAKGLEWDAVFLPALAEGVFPAGVIQHEDPVRFAAVLPFTLRLDAAALPDLPDDEKERTAVLLRSHADQEWRTAYVAVTRARHHLYASGSFWTGGARPRRRSPLFVLIDQHGDPVPGRVEDPGQRPEPRRIQDEWSAPDPLFPEGAPATLAAAAHDPEIPRRLAQASGIVDSYDRLVDQLRLGFRDLPEPHSPSAAPTVFTTSVTGLVTLASCPQRYRWSEVERLPRRPSDAARRGVELHRRIELHNRGSIAFDDADPGFYDAAGDDSPPVRGAFALFGDSRFARSRPILVEAPFTLVAAEGRVSGRIDAVYRDEEGGWEVVDFKSGRSSADPTRRVQLQVYALALAEAGLAPVPPDDITVTFAYFGSGEVEEVSEQVDGPWLAAARTEVDALVALAAGNDHPATPGDACRHCDFAHLCPAGQAWLEAQS